MRKLVVILLLLATFFVFLPDVESISGQGPSESDFNSWIQVTVPNFSGATVADIISALLPYIYGLAGFLILLYAVMGGYQIMTSQGEPKAMAQGRDKITYAIVGFIIMAVSYWILQLVGQILDIQQITDIFGG
jgi:hypothetical protein